MSAAKWIVVAALAAVVLGPASAAAAVERPRPSEVPGAETTMAPNAFQVYNDYASPERVYASGRVVVHYVVLGIDAPPLNDDDGDGVPDYVERVGQAADGALAYYEARGFRPPVADHAGPDGRPDLYVTRFAPGTLGVSFPDGRAGGGAFAVVSNNLDPSSERSFASVYATVAHELFHLVQFAYFGAGTDPEIPGWILEGTAAALETRVNPELEDIVAKIQLRRWFSATGRSMTAQTYGAQLLWRRLDEEQPRLLPALLTRLAAGPVTGEGQRTVAATWEDVTRTSFAAAFHRFAVSVATSRADDLQLARAPNVGVLAPLSVRYLRVSLPRRGHSMLTVTFPARRRGAATLVYRLESGVAGEPARTLRVAPRVVGHGRALAFTVTAASRATAMLVVSNGSDRAVPYTVGAR